MLDLEFDADGVLVLTAHTDDSLVVQAFVDGEPGWKWSTKTLWGSFSAVSKDAVVLGTSYTSELDLGDVAQDGNLETARMIERLGRRALAVRCDVTRSEDVQAALDQASAAFGGIDIAFNNAGVEQPVTATADLTEEMWDRSVGVNLRSVFLCMSHQIPVMLRRGGGVIVNTSSGAGVKGFKGQAAYCAAKHGIIGLTRAAALDYAGSNIRVNAVCPGIIDTPMMQRFTGGTGEGRQAVISQEPIGRMGRPEEIAAAVLWLCSPASSFVTGTALVVDGGQTV